MKHLWFKAFLVIASNVVFMILADTLFWYNKTSIIFDKGY